MSTKMNSNTHKVIIARWEGPEIIYAVPNDWDLEKVDIQYGVVYYDGEKVNPPSIKLETGVKYPIEVEDASYIDLDKYFDCEEDSEEEAETSQS